MDCCVVKANKAALNMVAATALSVLVVLCCCSRTTAETAPSFSVVRRQQALLTKRSDVQHQVQAAERKLHQVELDRRDKLEELEQLYRAHADLDKRVAFSKDVENEIADQLRNLHRIEGQRADCLEELDALYRGLSQVNHDVAECDREMH